MKGSKMSAEFVVEVFKIIRGYAGAAIGATQDLADVLEMNQEQRLSTTAKPSYFCRWIKRRQKP